MNSEGSHLTRSSVFVAALGVAALFVLRRLLQAFDSNAAYALCSLDGVADIYTVDDTNSRVDCFVVHNYLIADSGSLGLCTVLRHVHES